jgi:hypothetical protein
MATNIFYQTLTNMGVDPTSYYPVTTTAGASINPEYPGPPVAVGTKAFGTDGSEFVFVQASTSISLTDFVVINAGAAAAPFQANSINTTNVWSSLYVGIAGTGLVLKQSVTFIPAGAFFWAQTRGTFMPATNSGGFATGLSAPLASTGAQVPLYVALSAVATAGALCSTTTSLSPAFAGIICINSITISIAGSIVPPAGTLTSGVTVGPVVNLNNPRAIQAFSSAGAQLSGFGFG